MSDIDLLTGGAAAGGTGVVGVLLTFFGMKGRITRLEDTKMDKSECHLNVQTHEKRLDDLKDDLKDTQKTVRETKEVMWEMRSDIKNIIRNMPKRDGD